MKEHTFLLLLFGVLAVLIGIIFRAVYRSSISISDDVGVNHPTKKRFFFFLLLFACLLILLSVTLPKSPYFLYTKESPSVVVYASARQYLYALSTKPLKGDNEGGDSSIELPLNKLIEFRVEGIDVNHGFAIYDETAELITQTQAMPGYVNRLRWKFTRPGNYTILCLEYCGAGHPFMRASFTVK